MKIWSIQSRAFIGTIFLVLAALSACDNKNAESPEPAAPKDQPTLIRYHNYFSAQKFNLSFPQWFDSSVVKAKNLKSLIHSVYPKGVDFEPGDEDVKFPKEQFQYIFRKNGTVERLVYKVFQNHQVINTTQFHFQDFKAPNGYCEVEIESDVSLTDPVLPKSLAQTNIWKIFNEIDQNPDYTVLEDASDNTRLFIIENEDLWSPLILDRTLQPSPEDWILLGNALHPNKLYQVENKVKETNVSQFVYEHGHVVSYSVDKFPFVSKKTFRYNEENTCTEIIDSTFADDVFLSSSRSEMYYTETGDLYSIVTESVESAVNRFQFEVFQYEKY